MVNDRSDQQHLLSKNNNNNSNVLSSSSSSSSSVSGNTGTNADSTNIKYGSLNDNDTSTRTAATTVSTSAPTSASMIQVIISMIKNLVGCGALSLSYGIAYCTNDRLIGSLVIGPIIIITLGTIFGYYCWLIGKICNSTNHYTYRSAWHYSITSTSDSSTSSSGTSTNNCCTCTTSTISKSSSIAVSIATSLKAFLALLSYNTIVTDATLSLVPILSHYYYYIFYNIQIHIHQQHQQSTTNDFNHSNNEEFYISRTYCLVGITIFCLLPLCLLKNIKVLTPFSIVGTTGIVITCIVMILRWYDCSYDSPNGYYYVTLPTNYQPKFDTIIYNKSFSPAILPYICMVYEAFVMHYNSPRFYRELENNNLQRYNTVVSISFGSSCIMYTIIAVFGFLTFGSNCNSMILNNYSIYDPLISICRIAVILSTITAYPIVFLGLQDGIYDLFNISLLQQVQYKYLSTIITCILLLIITIISIYVYDLGLINAVGGGLVATAIVFVFPTIMLQSILYKQRVTKVQQRQQNSNINEDCTLLVNTNANNDDYNNNNTGSSNENNINNNIKSSTVDMYIHTSTIESYTTIVLAIIGVILGIVGAYIAVFKY